MNTYNINKLFCCMLVMLAAFSSCKKEAESTFDIFKGLSIDFKEAIGSDEVYVEFNLSKAASGANMSKVILTETGSTTPVYTATIDYANRYSYSSGVQVIKTSSPSTVAYTINVLDDTGKDITSQVAVTYPAGKLVVSNPVLVTDNETVTFPEGSTVYIDYNVHSDNSNIKYIWLESFATGSTESSRVNITTLADDAPDKRNFRGVTRLYLNRSGGSMFRLYITDDANDYIGDGYTTLHTNVEVGYDFAANKFLYAPKFDATAENPDLESACFYSISKKKAFSYAEAKENSADIDFCIYLTSTGNTVVPYFLNLFSLKNPTNPLAGKFDFTDWTKRGTTFFTSTPSVAQVTGDPLTAPTVFNTVMVSGLAIKQAVGAGRYANLLTRTAVTNIAAGNIMFFKTPEGKFGAVYFNNFAKDYQGRWFANIDVKIEK